MFLSENCNNAHRCQNWPLTYPGSRVYGGRFSLSFLAAGGTGARHGQAQAPGGATGAGNQRHASGGVSNRAVGVGGGADVPGLGDSEGVGMRRVASSVLTTPGVNGGGGASGGDDVKPLLVSSLFSTFFCVFSNVFLFILVVPVWFSW